MKICVIYLATLITPRVVIPAKAGIQEKNWIPGQARNDKLHRIYVVMYKLETCAFVQAVQTHKE